MFSFGSFIGVDIRFLVWLFGVKEVGIESYFALFAFGLSSIGVVVNLFRLGEALNKIKELSNEY